MPGFWAEGERETTALSAVRDETSMTPTRYTIETRELSKSYPSAPLFKGISLTLVPGDSLCVTGPNGSGKSTLLQILAGLRLPSGGTVSHFREKALPREEWVLNIGYTGPLVNPYDELTAIENLRFAMKKPGAIVRARALLQTFGLWRRRDQKVAFYSTGMKQRLKLVLAAADDPAVLMLDEPGAGLDTEGRESLRCFVEGERSRKILLIATNEASEERLCAGGIRLGS